MLSQLSREEIKTLKPDLLKADQTLMFGLSHYFRGMAEVESVDLDEINASILKAAGPHFKDAQSQLTKSIEAGKKILETLSGIKNTGGFRARIRTVSSEIESFHKTIEALQEKVTAGKYPSAADCAAAASALTKIVSPFERNAQVELGGRDGK